MSSRFKRNNLPVKPNNKLVPSNGDNGNGKNGNGKMTANQKIFADEWLIDRNGTRAYKVAYPKIKNDESAAVMASLTLRKIKIKAYIDAHLILIRERAEINQDWVLRRYKMLADYHIDDFFHDDGTMKSFSEIPREALYAIGGFKQSKKTITTLDKITITDRIKEFKLPNKRDVLGDIGRHIGMFAKDNEQKGGRVGNQLSIVGQTIQVNLVE